MRERLIIKAAILGLAVVSLSGCWFKKKPVIVVPPVVVPQPQPQPPAPEPKPEPPKEDPKPSVAPQTAPTTPEPKPELPKLEKPSPSPAQKKRPSATKPVTQAPAAPIPQLGEILSPAQRSQYEKSCEQSLRRARAALATTSGKKLSASQTESASRVRSFIRQAEELQSRDVATAVQLAQRADLLAQQLAQSLR